MFNESILSLSLNNLKDTIFTNLSMFDIALAYILVYVVYKVIGRYIYFKPQEHSSKINRTFLVISLLVTSIHFLDGVIGTLPFISEYRWLYAIAGLTLLVAPLSIIMDRIVWKNVKNSGKYLRYQFHMPIAHDYYRTASVASDSEGVKTTRENLHSDALLNIFALYVFIHTGVKWAQESAITYGNPSFIFSVIISLWIAAIFIDRGVFSWIEYFEQKYHVWWLKRKNESTK